MKSRPFLPLLVTLVAIVAACELDTPLEPAAEAAERPASQSLGVAADGFLAL